MTTRMLFMLVRVYEKQMRDCFHSRFNGHAICAEHHTVFVNYLVATFEITYCDLYGRIATLLLMWKYVSACAIDINRAFFNLRSVRLASTQIEPPEAKQLY